MINIDHIKAYASFKNKIASTMVTDLLYMKYKTSTRLQFKMGQCYIYEDQKCMFSSNKMENIIDMYKVIYSRVDLPIIIRCIFNHQPSLFFLLPL